MVDKRLIKIIGSKTAAIFCSLYHIYLNMRSDVYCLLEVKEDLLFNCCDNCVFTFSFLILRFVIERQSLDGTKKESVVTSALLNVEGLAVDWMGRNIYWTDEVVKLYAVLIVLVCHVSNFDIVNS